MSEVETPKKKKKRSVADADAVAAPVSDSVSEMVLSEDSSAMATDAASEAKAAFEMFERPDLDFVEGAASGLEALAQRLAETNAENENGDVIVEDSEASEVVASPTEQSELAGFDEAANIAEEEAEDASGEFDGPKEFIDNDKVISIIESLLFATDKPVSLAMIRVIFKNSNVRTKDISRALDTLASAYAAADRGVTLEEIHGGYQLRTKVDNADYLKRLQKARPFKLSGPALEVMAIAAYKQPITKTEVDQIRGVESGHLMRALMERGLVAFGEKSDLPGRPMTYVTTRKFLEIFGLRNIKELPTLSQIDELLPEGIGDEEDKETLSDLTSALSNEIKASYSEGEEELNDIEGTLKVIDTTSDFFEQEKIRQRAERDKERAQDISERITVGELVEEKDKRWLARYEAKLAEVNQANTEEAAPPAPVIVEDEAEEANAGLAAQLEALTAETSAVVGDEDEEDFEAATDRMAAGLEDAESDEVADLEADSFEEGYPIKGDKEPEAGA